MSLTFLPIFLCAGVLLSTGILLIRIYHDEIKNRFVNYRTILAKSWDVIIGASYFSIPIILSYLLLWMLMGIFVLLRQIPLIGEFFGVVLAFAPFLINLGSLVLCLLSLSLLFFVAPIIALRGLNRMQLSKMIVTRFQKDIFSNLSLSLIAILPFLFVMSLLMLAAFLTGAICVGCEEPVYNIIQWFFIMIPFTAVLAPTVIFFFNFAAEAHVLLHSRNH